MPKVFESWQFWSASKKLLGESYLLRVLGRRNGRTIRMYSADPKYTQERCKDPLEHLHTIFTELDTYGRGDVARRAIAYLNSAIDDHHVDQVEDIKQTIDAEILADYQAVSAMQQVITSGASVDVVKAATEAACEEIERTLSKYMVDSGETA